MKNIGQTLTASFTAVALLRKIVLLGLFLATVIAAPNAKADLLVEPYLGYGFGNFKTKTIGGDSSVSLNGVNLGARVAYALPLIYFGLDYDLGLDKADSDTSATRSALYAFVGAHLILFRVWAGYGFLNSLDVSDDGGKFSGGSGWKIGAGFTGIPFIDINVEYFMTSYGKYRSTTGLGSSTIGSGNIVSSAKDSTIMLSVSLPLTY